MQGIPHRGGGGQMLTNTWRQPAAAAAPSRRAAVFSARAPSARPFRDSLANKQQSSVRATRTRSENDAPRPTTPHTHTHTLAHARVHRTHHIYFLLFSHAPPLSCMATAASGAGGAVSFCFFLCGAGSGAGCTRQRSQDLPPCSPATTANHTPTNGVIRTALEIYLPPPLSHE